jgi:hypothetical protein
MSSKGVVVTLSLAIGLTACAGRTAVWQEDPGGSGATSEADGSGSNASADGDAAWAKRTSPAAVREAITAWESALECEPGTASPKERCADVETSAATLEALTKLTRAYYFLADGYLRADKNAYLATMDGGVFWGERALVAASPEFEEKMRAKSKFSDAIKVIEENAVPAGYWYAASLGKWAKRTSFAVLVGQKDNIRATMTRVLELDPEFFHWAPDRYFGAFYAIAPKFAGGDLAKSHEHYDKSLERADYYLGTKVLMAENLAVKEDDVDTFTSLLEEVVATPDSAVPEELWPEAAVEREKAKELLAQKEDIF